MNDISLDQGSPPAPTPAPSPKEKITRRPRQPKLFYRYQPCNMRTLNLLCEDKLYFANPSTFNDPLDSRPTLHPDSSLSELETLLSILVKRRVRLEMIEFLNRAQLRGEKAKEHAQKQANFEASRVLDEIDHYDEDPDYEISEEEAKTHLLTHSIQEELSRHYERGVCCFSSTCSSPLLWSHYGDHHRGLCIGYDLIRDPEPTLHKVMYGRSRHINTSTIVEALLHDDKHAQGKLDHSMFLIKSKNWSHEHEWRLIGERGEQHSPIRLRELVFGLRCPTSEKHVVAASLRDREEQIKIAEIYEIHGSYRLSRRQTDLEEMSCYYPRVARSGREIFRDQIDS